MGRETVGTRPIPSDSLGYRRVFCETLGTELHLPEKIDRIISFSPAATETIAMLGMEDALVGVSAFCARPETIRSKRKVGSYNTVDRKVLAELDPQLILTATGYQRDFALQLGKEYPVYAIELPVSVPGIVDMVAKLGLVTNQVSAATRLVHRLLEVLSGQKPLISRLRVYVEIDLGGPVSFGVYSYITDALRFLGVESIYGDLSVEWLTPDLERVRLSDPDAILYEAKMYKPTTPSDLRQVLEKRGWHDMRAVRNGHVFMTPGPLDFLAHHGPSFILEALPWLRDKLEIVEREP